MCPIHTPDMQSVAIVGGQMEGSAPGPKVYADACQPAVPWQELRYGHVALPS